MVFSFLVLVFLFMILQSESIQALLSRENQVRSSELSLQQLSSQILQTDHLMSDLFDGLKELDSILSSVTHHQADNKGRGTWSTLKPACALLLKAHQRTGELSNFRIGFMKELEKSMKDAATNASAAAKSKPPSRTQTPATVGQQAETTIEASASNPVTASSIPASASASASSASSIVAADSSMSIISHVSSTPSSSSSSSSYLHFQHVGIQAPLCRWYQRDQSSTSSDGQCQYGASCRNLHLYENDRKPIRTCCVDELFGEELEQMKYGIPYVLYHLAVGEEAQCQSL